MIYLVALSLGLMLAGNYAISRNFLYPPAIFTGGWLLSIIGLVLSGDTFYAVSAETLLVYLVGALAFSMGGLVVFSGSAVNNVKPVSFSPMQITRICRFLDFFLLVALVGFPFFWAYVFKNADFSNPNLLNEQRQGQVEASTQIYNPLDNLGAIAQFLAMGMYVNNDGSFSRKWRTYLSILLAIVYGGMTGTKGNIVHLILNLSFISFMRAGRINFVVLGSMFIIAMTLFAAGLLVVNLSYMDLDVFSMDTIALLVKHIQGYWLGGLVAFERIVQSPESMESVRHLNRFFLETANSLGANFYLPSRHAVYTHTSPTDFTNVYTIYFSYFKDYGWLGVLLGMSMLGGLLTWIYLLAHRGNPLAIIFYGVNMTGILLSVQADFFVLALNKHIKMLIIFYVMYYVVPRFSILNHSTRGGQSA